MPVANIRDEDKLQDQTVRKIIAFALDLNAQIARFRDHTMVDLGEFDAILSEEYGAKIGGEKGTLYRCVNGKLSIMVGGSEAAFTTVKPLFELMGKNITLVGGNGDGQTTKVANQIIVALNIEAVAEALVFASKAGADPAKVRQALMGGFAASRILEVHGERMIKRTFNPGFRIGLHQKDLSLALSGARTLGVALPQTANRAPNCARAPRVAPRLGRPSFSSMPKRLTAGGALVRSVEAGGPAEKAGVEPGDIKTLDDLRRLRNENAALRARTKAAEELADKAARRLHRALVESTHRLEYADDLPFDPEHLDDDTKLTAALDALLAERPGRAKRAVVGDAGQDKRGGADPGVDLLGILRGGK